MEEPPITTSVRTAVSTVSKIAHYARIVQIIVWLAWMDLGSTPAATLASLFLSVKVATITMPLTIVVMSVRPTAPVA